MDQQSKSGFLATTAIGGFLFLLPLLLILYLLKVGIDLVEVPAGHLASALPVFRLLGPLGDLLVAIIILVLIAFLAGLLAKSAIGNSVNRRLRNSPLSMVPPVSFVRGLLSSFSADEEKVSVVLVPSDQGQTIAFVFGPVEGEQVCVYVPSAPNWMSGSISFAQRKDVQETSLSFLEATRLIRMLGSQQAISSVGLKASQFLHGKPDGPAFSQAAVPDASNALQVKES